VNLHVTIRAIGVLRIEVVLWASRLDRTDVMRHAVAGQTKLSHATRRQQTWICGTVRCMTGNTAFSFHRRMFVNKRTLLVCVTLYASSVCACRKSCLFELKPAVRIVTVAALHRAFQHFVVERQIELVLDLRVATQAELWLVHLQQANGRDTRLLRVSARDKDV